MLAGAHSTRHPFTQCVVVMVERLYTTTNFFCKTINLYQFVQLVYFYIFLPSSSQESASLSAYPMTPMQSKAATEMKMTHRAILSPFSTAICTNCSFVKTMNNESIFSRINRLEMSRVVRFVRAGSSSWKEMRRWIKTASLYETYYVESATRDSVSYQAHFELIEDISVVDKFSISLVKYVIF